MGIETVNERLKKMEAVVNDVRPQKAPDRWHVGIDLGTANIVVTVTDEAGEPLAAFMEWAEVVRDGVVVDYIGAVDIVRRLVKKANEKLGITIDRAATGGCDGLR